MSGPTDWEDLAKRYLDLWQEQLTALGTDQQLTAQFARLAQDMAARGLASPMAGFAGMAGSGQADGADEAGAPAAGDASGQRDQRLDELERRIVAVEKRLDDLAGGADGSR